MTTYIADAALTFPSQNSYANHSEKSRFSDGKSRRKRAFGYVRVSTDMQARYGLSLEAQMENGHRPKRGGQWYAQQVKMLLIS